MGPPRSTLTVTLFPYTTLFRSAEVAAQTAVTQAEIDRLDRERSELLVEASRRDADRARREAERLRIQAQIQAEEAARLREQADAATTAQAEAEGRSEEHTSELQSLMRISYAVFCLKKKKKHNNIR